MSHAQPHLPLVSFDSLKLRRNWTERPRTETEQALGKIVSGPAWIVEGGPSLLPLTLPLAEVVVWLDPPTAVRAWRLLLRPSRNLGRTRPELPEGNTDWPLAQYRFGWKSLVRSRYFRRSVTAALAEPPQVQVMHCRTARQTKAALTTLTQQSGPPD